MPLLLLLVMTIAARAARLDITNAGIVVREGAFCVEECTEAVLTEVRFLEEMNRTLAAYSVMLEERLAAHLNSTLEGIAALLDAIDVPAGVANFIRPNDICVSHCVLESAPYIFDGPGFCCTPAVADVCHTSGPGRADNPCPAGYECGATGDCVYTAAPAQVVFVADGQRTGGWSTTSPCSAGAAVVASRMSSASAYTPHAIGTTPLSAPCSNTIVPNAHILDSRGNLLAMNGAAAPYAFHTDPAMPGIRYHADGSAVNTALGTLAWSGCAADGSGLAAPTAVSTCNPAISYRCYSTLGSWREGTDVKSGSTADITHAGGTGTWLEAPPCTTCGQTLWLMCISAVAENALILPRDAAPAFVPP